MKKKKKIKKKTLSSREPKYRGVVTVFFTNRPYTKKTGYNKGQPYMSMR